MSNKSFDQQLSAFKILTLLALAFRVSKQRLSDSCLDSFQCTGYLQPSYNHYLFNGALSQRHNQFLGQSFVVKSFYKIDTESNKSFHQSLSVLNSYLTGSCFRMRLEESHLYYLQLPGCSQASYYHHPFRDTIPLRHNLFQLSLLYLRYSTKLTSSLINLLINYSHL